MDGQLISIIVACYNVEKYLDRCIDSIVRQSYSNLEIILVDDGSTDKTGEICDKWVKKDARVRVLHRKNGGPSDARNAGIRGSKGKWLGFVDGDDYILPAMYSELYAHRVEGGIAVCGSEIEKDGKRIPCPAIDTVLSPKEAVDLYIENELQSHYRGLFTYFGSYACNKLYDRSLFNTVLYPKGKKYEDMYIIMEILHIARKVCFFPSCGYIYVQNPDSITHGRDIIHESFYARKKQKEQLQQYWGITDSRMEELIACEYFLMLSRYSFLTAGEQAQNKHIAKWAWKNLQQIGYFHFPLKMKLKLFLFVHFPGLARNLRKIYHKG